MSVRSVLLSAEKRPEGQGRPTTHFRNLILSDLNRELQWA